MVWQWTKSSCLEPLAGHGTRARAHRHECCKCVARTRLVLHPPARSGVMRAKTFLKIDKVWNRTKHQKTAGHIAGLAVLTPVRGQNAMGVYIGREPVQFKKKVRLLKTLFHAKNSEISMSTGERLPEYPLALLRPCHSCYDHECVIF